MNVIINSDCEAKPQRATLLSSEGQPALNFLVALGYDALNPPLADLLAYVHHLDGDWCILSPIYWQASHNDAMIMATDNDIGVDESEMQLWFARLQDYLSEEGMSLHYYSAYIWLLRMDKQPALNAKSVTHMLNRSLMPELAQLDASMYWQKFFTECQMFFASHSTQPSVNGVWAWGNGKLATKKNVAICTDVQHSLMAQACSDNVTIYSPALALKQFEFILLKDLSVLSTEHQNELTNTSACWYWNNIAYNQSKSNCFTRIWRLLTHAH